MLLLYSLHEVICNYVSIDNIIDVLRTGITDNDAAVRSMAIKAACDVITSFIEEKEISKFTCLIPLFLQSLQQSLQQGDCELVLRLFGLFEDAALDGQTFLGDNALNVVVLCCNALGDDSLMYSLRVCAGACLIEMMTNCYVLKDIQAGAGEGGDG